MATISKATVCDIKEYGSDVREYTLKLDKNNYFEAGTFLLLTLEEREDYTRWPAESRNFSIASAYNKDGLIRLIIRKVGAYTTKIFEKLKVDSTCVVKYAFGDFLLPFYDKKNPICCIAGGTGIAPILSFCEELSQAGQNDRLHVFYSFKNKEERLRTDILENTISKEKLHLYATRENIDAVACRRIETNDIINSGLPIRDTHFYICGSELFTSYFKQALLAAGAQNIYTDEW